MSNDSILPSIGSSQGAYSVPNLHPSGNDGSSFMCPCGTASTLDPPEKHKIDCPARMLTLMRQNKELELTVERVPSTSQGLSGAPTYLALGDAPRAGTLNEHKSNDPHIPIDSDKPHVCNICGKQCDSKGYRRHVLSHSEERPHMCSECGDSFAQNSALQRHIMSHTGEKPFSCEVCGESFKVNYHLKRHYMIHAGIRPYSCEECGEKFSRNSHLKRHVMIHSGEKPFPCMQCGKKFLNSNHLKRHSMTHTGEKPYACTECGERFSRSSHLKRHLLSHSGEKPFKCDECTQMFVTLESLRRHHITHSGQKPFPCEVCGKRFMDNNHLKRHLTVHDDKPLSLSPQKRQEHHDFSQFVDKKPIVSQIPKTGHVKFEPGNSFSKHFGQNLHPA